MEVKQGQSESLERREAAGLLVLPRPPKSLQNDTWFSRKA